ncbi:hypothetical protein D3C87_2047550 [compost metagenome]
MSAAHILKRLAKGPDVLLLRPRSSHHKCVSDIQQIKSAVKKQCEQRHQTVNHHKNGVVALHHPGQLAYLDHPAWQLA